MKRILFVVGARPNFMKIAPIMEAMSRYANAFEQLLVHTGQHYDANMSQVFFDELGLPKPDLNLQVGSGSHAQQTAQVMQRFEPVLLEYKPDWIVVPGDVNSTLACALVASKLGIKIAHVEAGLRSFDRTMPEEINRVLTDQISDMLLTPSEDANANLRHEGIPQERIHFVGNVMIDTLVRLLPKAAERWPTLAHYYGLDRFVLVTLHRPSNVDRTDTLAEIVHALNTIAAEIPIIFPIHPRTRKRIDSLGLTLDQQRIYLLEPLSYLDFLAVQAHAQLVLTDSGGVQEETTYLGIPCLTIRANTERPVTITQGTNILVNHNTGALVTAIEHFLDPTFRRQNNYQPPRYWDGTAAERIAASLYNSR
ncbi:MAG: UDP-N-acetylglucosamine 2-epimerase (non-hydrolyzing) [Caldilineaceae bacterium]